ncbi:MAG: RagB/SusD family nutrient uptake outer membrane protein [Muribaculaceae bacterium]
MKKNSIFNGFIAGLMLVGAASCTGNYLDINSNPYQPGDLTADDYGLGSAMTNLASTVISSDVNTTQFTECLLGGTMGGYFADSNAGWSNTISNFNATNDWTRVLLLSDRIIPTLYSNLTQVEQISEQTNNPVPFAIARIIKVAAMHRVTDTYGPIPYSQIGQDGKINIPYDTQEQVYDKLFEELDESINTLTENRNAALVSSIDFVYGGNVVKWVKFANSLKLRLAMRLANVSPDKARKHAEAAVSHELGVIENNADNATWKYFGAINNPLFVAVRYNEEASGGDTHPAADIIAYMNGYNDNRRAAYFEDSKWPGQQFVGLRRSINMSKVKEYFSNYSRVKISSSDAVLWMNAAEVSFLRAEGTAIYGFNMGGSAADFYNDGIRLSFEQWGVSGAEGYMTDATSKPALYIDPAGLNTYENVLSNITIKWDEGASKAEKQERIITQKWIALWPLGNEAWADYRRTGYPRLIPATEEGNLSGGIVDSNRGARRMPYPSEEYTSNTANIQYAVSNYLGGPDNMATDVWWAKTK